jgi:hypothetical protein
VHEGLIGRHDLAHPLLDPRQVVAGKRVRQVEVVVEAVLDRGPDRVPGAGE